MTRAMLDFELQITSTQVELLSSPAGSGLRAPFEPPLTPDELKYLRGYLERQASYREAISLPPPLRSFKTIEQVGVRLFESLFADEELRRLYERSRAAAGENGLRIKLRVDEMPSIYPWELLRDPNDDFLALSPALSLVRYQPMPVAATPLQVSGPLWVLIACGYAHDLQLGREVKRIEAALAPLKAAGRVKIVVLERASLRAMHQHLRGKSFHLLHYLGHSKSPSADESGGLLLWNDNRNGGAWVEPLRLWRMLRRANTIRLVWLNSCSSGVGSSLRPLESVALELVRAGVPAVIANQLRIRDQVAIQLASEFYKALAYGFPVDQALAEARATISLTNLHSLEWATPVLFMHTPNGTLFASQNGSAPHQNGSAPHQNGSAPHQNGKQPYKRIALTVANPVMTLIPGQPAMCRLTLGNKGATAQRVVITVEGVPEGWVQGANQALVLDSKANTPVGLTINVPQSSGGVAGEYPVVVRARSLDAPIPSVMARLRWTLLPAAQDQPEAGAQEERKKPFDSKAALDGLSALTGVGSALATVWAIFAWSYPGEQERLLPTVLALLVLVLFGACFYYRQRQAARSRAAEMPDVVGASAALRGLLPFEEGDELPGRAQDVRDLYTLVANSSFRFGVLWGESGSGKTSLLRAGLLPTLRRQGFYPLYVPHPRKEPQEAIRVAFAKAGVRPSENLDDTFRGIAPPGKAVVVIFDQFEEFFLTNPSKASRVAFSQWLGEAVADESLPVRFLGGIRSDFFAQVQTLAPHIPEPTALRTTYQLENFDRRRARQILRRAASVDGISFEPGLVRAVVEDLDVEGIVRPAELQIVGTRLKRKQIVTLNRYEAAGRARGILSSYISDEINLSANQETARLILRLMGAEGGTTKSHTDWSLDEVVRQVNDASSNKSLATERASDVQSILKQFVTARILIQTDDDKYNLVHDYLAPYVRSATEGTQTKQEQANRLLKQEVAEYRENPKMRLSFSRLQLIQRHASEKLKRSAQARELIKKSWRKFYARGAMAVAPLMALFAVYLFFLTNAYYLSYEDQGGTSSIVVRRGHPNGDWLPGFRGIYVESDFTLNDLESPVGEISREEVTGFWFELNEQGDHAWAEQLQRHLSFNAQMRMRRWVDSPEGVADNLIKALNDRNPNRAHSALSALVQLGQAQPQVVSEILPELQALLNNPPTDFFMHSEASFALAQLGQMQPEAVTEQMLQTLSDLLTNSPLGPHQPGQIATALAQLGQAQPEFVTEQMLQTVLDLLTNSQLDSYDRAQAARALAQLGQAQPEFVTEEMLLYALANSQSVSYSRFDFGMVLIELGEANPDAITQPVLDQLIKLLEFETDHETRSQVLMTLGELGKANPEAVSSQILEKVLQLLTDSQTDRWVRESAVSALKQIGPARVEQVRPQLPQELQAFLSDEERDLNVRYSAWQALGELGHALSRGETQKLLSKSQALLTDSQATPHLRQSAVYVLGQLAHARPDLVSEKMLPEVVNLLHTSQNEEMRATAMMALGELGHAKPEFLTREMLQELVDLLHTSQDEQMRATAMMALEQLGHAKPEFLTREMLQELVDLLHTSQNEEMRATAVMALGQLGQAKSEFLTREMLQEVVDLLHRSQNEETRVTAVMALAQLGQAKPEFLTREMLRTLLSDSQTNGWVPFVGALESLASSAPELVMAEEDALYDLSDQQVLIALGRAYYEEKLSLWREALVPMLQDDKYSKRRLVGGYALFLLAANDPNQAKAVKESLKGLQSDERPHVRIAGSRTLEMIGVWERSMKEADRDDPKAITRLRDKLYQMQEPYSFGGRGEEHMAFAITITLEQLEQPEKPPQQAQK